MTSEEVRVEIEAAFGKYDRADNDCPARKTNLFRKKCPKCFAMADTGCGLEITAAYTFIAEVRRILEQGR